MLGVTRHVGIVVFASAVLAEIVPTTPTEDQIFHIGDPCSIVWDPDTAPDGWKTMRIDLMTGIQPGLSLVTEVADSVDSTSSGPGWYSWTCPTVDFDGPVYSYMFTPSDGPDPPVFSPQFTITGFNGSIDLPDVSVTSGLPLPAPTDTDVADPSSGAAHIGNPGPNASSGEEMLESVDQRLGGSDSSSDNADSGANFLAQAIASGAQAAVDQPSATSATLVHLLDQSTQTSTEGHAAAESTSTQTRMLTLVSSSTTASASAASPSHTTTTSADASFRQTGSMSEAIILALFALCAGHLFME